MIQLLRHPCGYPQAVPPLIVCYFPMTRSDTGRVRKVLILYVPKRDPCKNHLVPDSSFCGCQMRLSLRINLF